MPEFGRCDDPSYNAEAVRLFDCAHHCMKMVCLQHLIDHDRLLENNRRQLDIVQVEFKRLYSIYSSLIDEDKIRYEYEQKLNDYKKLVNEVNILLENNSNNIEQLRVIIEKLKQSINENINNQNAIIHIHRIAGFCPLWTNGTNGLNQKHHSHRLCRKKRFIDLSNHMHQYHGLLTPIANIIARTVESKIPDEKRLISNDLQVTDPRRSFFCPLRIDYQSSYYLSAVSLRTHLIDVHRMNPSIADIKVKTIKKLNKNQEVSKIQSTIFQINKDMESTSNGLNQSEYQNFDLPIKICEQSGGRNECAD
ncbi:unnamed protein product [Rotaria magnacalcarata]|uniref:Uncharacterized protein n=3 Tax=Rotaria magnacalcarata TaxID=392030 RepID=A0A816S0L1_9BILA|nr:unnamed protein product [Rotaria magnacalcarata]CAF2117598.1 unnamed protein product [Rotaria magnacalcarata]